jgi:hypothetical protein
MRNRRQPLDLVTTKWSLILPPNFSINWSEVWDPERARKEVSLLWQLWHKAIAVNVWRGKISRSIDRTCPMCSTGAEESVVHRFWACDHSQQFWLFTTRLLNRLSSPFSSLSWSRLARVALCSRGASPLLSGSCCGASPCGHCGSLITISCLTRCYGIISMWHLSFGKVSWSMQKLLGPKLCGP